MMLVLPACALSAPVPEPSACTTQDAGVDASRPPTYRYVAVQDRQEYATAEASCVAMGGHLARLHGDSAADVQRLADACDADEPCWTGLGYDRAGVPSAWAVWTYEPMLAVVPTGATAPELPARYYPLCEIATP